MCGACGLCVVNDPVLGPVRTVRQHLIVAQTINRLCRSWPGAPKVAATSSGWLVTGATGATEAVSTVEALWSSVLRSGPVEWSGHGEWSKELHHFWDEPGATAGLGAAGEAESQSPTGAPEKAPGDSRDLSLRVLELGQHLIRMSGAAPGS